MAIYIRIVKWESNNYLCLALTKQCNGTGRVLYVSQDDSASTTWCLNEDFILLIYISTTTCISWSCCEVCGTDLISLFLQPCFGAICSLEDVMPQIYTHVNTYHSITIIDLLTDQWSLLNINVKVDRTIGGFITNTISLLSTRIQIY